MRSKQQCAPEPAHVTHPGAEVSRGAFERVMMMQDMWRVLVTLLEGSRKTSHEVEQVTHPTRRTEQAAIGMPARKGE